MMMAIDEAKIGRRMKKVIMSLKACVPLFCAPARRAGFSPYRRAAKI
jgi:hypothetical protein